MRGYWVGVALRPKPRARRTARLPTMQEASWALERVEMSVARFLSAMFRTSKIGAKWCSSPSVERPQTLSGAAAPKQRAGPCRDAEVDVIQCCYPFRFCVFCLFAATLLLSSTPTPTVHHALQFSASFLTSRCWKMHFFQGMNRISAQKHPKLIYCHGCPHCQRSSIAVIPADRLLSKHGPAYSFILR